VGTDRTDSDGVGGVCACVPVRFMDLILGLPKLATPALDPTLT
jgi:hypothetical protein